MSKDAYYFPHDSNAKDDPKCVLLIEQLGPEGYGIYWILVETLRDQPEYKYPVSLLPALARRYNTTPEKVKTVVGNYDLFVVDGDNFFFSQSLIDRMIPLEKRKEQARLAGLKSAERRLLGNGGSTDVQQPFNEGSTIRRDKIRVNKNIEDIEYSKGRKAAAFSPPSLSEVSDYISDKHYSVNPAQFIDHYTAVGWMIGKNKMKDWRAAVRNWNSRNEHTTPQPAPTTKPLF